jgi:hypothetical protein
MSPLNKEKIMEIKSVICSLEVQPQDLTEVAKAAGLRIVARTGGTPVYYQFVPDFGRAGEFEWSHTNQELQQAMVADPQQEPVVARKSDMLRALKALAGDISADQARRWAQMPGEMRDCAKRNLGTDGGDAWAKYLIEVLNFMDAIGVSDREFFALKLENEAWGELPPSGSREADSEVGIEWSHNHNDQVQAKVEGLTLYLRGTGNDGRSEENLLVLIKGENNMNSINILERVANHRQESVYAEWEGNGFSFVVNPTI